MLLGRNPAPTDEGELARKGKERRSFGLRETLDIALDLVTGYVGLRSVRESVTIFGSARCRPGEASYETAREVGGLLAEAGYDVMTGGGPGVMEAASRGAKEAGGRTLGCNVRLAPEQKPNDFLDRVITFRRFSVRKAMLIHHSRALIVLPGGFGTLDEVFEAAVLLQKEQMPRVRVVLVDTVFWAPLRELLEGPMRESGAIDAGDVSLFSYVDTATDAVRLVRESCAAGREDGRLRRRLQLRAA